jgi:hypothetical protein
MNIDAIAGKVLGEIKILVGKTWDSWTDDERKLVGECAKDSVSLMIRAAAGEDVAKERALVNASLKNIKVAALGSASRVLWDAALKVFFNAANFLRTIQP